eukprot:GILK01005921.1.p1 GENE.GILK01005921.1~~GILK01005921.1.p1  ORF type:complete len:710 (-),score=184.34 GILK01005921.1:174-2168(-)
MADRKLENPPNLTQLLESQRDSTSLVLSDAFIGDEGCNTLSNFLRDHPDVSEVDLRGNNIRGDGACTLAMVIRGNNNLRSLSLEWNSIGTSDKGMQMLADAISVNHSISHLDLRNNRIGPNGATAIANALRQNTTLVHLDLRWNDIGPTGGSALAQALQRNTTVVELLLSGNKLHEETLKQIDVSLHRNKTGAGRKLDMFSPMHTERARSPPRTYPNISLAEMETSKAHMMHAVQDDVHVPLRVLAREKEHVEEMQAKFQAEAASHAKTEKRLDETRIELEQERRRGREKLEEIQKEIEGYKQAKQRAEEAHRLCKEEMVEQELKNQKVIQNLDIRLQRAETDKEDLTLELTKTKEELTRLSRDSGDKMSLLEERLNHAKRQYISTDESSKSSLEKLRQQHSEEVRELTSGWESRLKIAEETARMAKNGRLEAEDEAKKLRSAMLSLKMEHEERLAELEKRLKQEEERRFQVHIRNLEDRMKNVEESRDNALSRNEELQRELTKSEKARLEEVVQHESAVTRLKHEKAALDHTIQRLQAEIERLSTELIQSESRSESSTAEREDMKRALQSAREAQNQKLSQLLAEHSNERKTLELTIASRENQIKELQGQLRERSLEIGNIKQEHERRIAGLESSVASLIQQKFADYRKHHLSDMDRSFTTSS